MSKILVTGASGDLGRKTLLHLLKRTPAANLIGLVRDPGKAKDLADLGIELRQGDYMEPESLLKAFDGVVEMALDALRIPHGKGGVQAAIDWLGSQVKA